MDFDALEAINARPQPFGAYTAEALWTDPHVAKRMLAFHLDPTNDLASRNAAFIARSVAWLLTRFRLTETSQVADIGCGPGLYANALARQRVQVTGIDFSMSSLAHARQVAVHESLPVRYQQGNYLDVALPAAGFDLVLMITCDFCALSSAQRALLLRRLAAALRPGGHVVLDVYSPVYFDQREEVARYQRNLLDGFWAPGTYYGFLNTFKYERERLVLDKYTIVEAGRTRTICNWFQCFTPAEVSAEFAAAGIEVLALHGDVAGSAYTPDATEFAIVATRR